MVKEMDEPETNEERAKRIQGEILDARHDHFYGQLEALRSMGVSVGASETEGLLAQQMVKLSSTLKRGAADDAREYILKHQRIRVTPPLG